jgi:hypothetical protein
MTLLLMGSREAVVRSSQIPGRVAKDWIKFGVLGVTAC